MGPIVVSHGLGSYPVYVEAGVLGKLESLVQVHLPRVRVAVLMDTTLHELYQAGRLGGSWKAETITFAAGESAKSRETWAQLTDELLGRGFGRDSGLVAVGGGVTGDLVGFVAATYMRGLSYIQVPTTLLAMVDASIGGKTGVDTSKGKNLVGAFHHPAAVIADPLVLGTLPERTFRAGLAEAVKHGVIADRDYFEWIESQVEPIGRRDPETLARLIRRSVEIKAEVVSSDERESGCRAILNAGHTIAHALERVSEFQLPHGEAVALGLVAECELAVRVGIAAPPLRSRVAELLDRLRLPVHLNRRWDPAPVVASMGTDKKNRSGKVHFALPAELGRMHRTNGWTTPVPKSAIEAALQVIS